MNYRICSNCGADEGLHHYETKQCPLHGIEESRINSLTGKFFPQRWAETRFEEEDRLKKAAPQLLKALHIAKETIKALHGDEAWDLYQNSPEMKTINDALNYDNR